MAEAKTVKEVNKILGEGMSSENKSELTMALKGLSETGVGGAALVIEARLWKRPGG